MTCPEIGNYGVNATDVESWRPHVAGFLVRQLSPVPSNPRSESSLDQYLQKHGVPGVSTIDTCSLTKLLRVKGAMKSCISTESISGDEAVRRARDWHGIVGVDYVKEVTHPNAFARDPEDKLSKGWRIERRSDGQMRYTSELPDADLPIVAFDYGIKYNIMRKLRQRGFRVQVVPATANAGEVLSYKATGAFLSNGPGDPEVQDYAHNAVRDLMGRVPIFGICLRHQILAYSFGERTFKLRFGHRGANQPVKDLRTEKVSITAQNHGFAVDPKRLDAADVEITQVNLNDQTVEGMRHTKLPFSACSIIRKRLQDRMMRICCLIDSVN
jgi:carbamoyl-phosphate synthase small subunit